MSKALYKIEQKSINSFVLYESGIPLVSFSRSNFREQMETVGRGNGWIGSILRLFLKKYPPEVKFPIMSKSDILRNIGLERMVDHLRAQGFRVYKKEKVSNMDMIKHLEASGYMVEGLVNDCFYSTAENEIAEAVR